MKELRLRGIDDQSANAFLPAFIADYNQRLGGPENLPGTPTACSMTRRTSSSPSMKAAAIHLPLPQPRVPDPRTTATASVAPPSPSVTARRPLSLGSAKARPSTTESRSRPDTDPKKSLCVPSTPLPPAQTPQVQTLPRSPLESLGSPPPSPFHPYPMSPRPALACQNAMLRTKGHPSFPRKRIQGSWPARFRGNDVFGGRCLSQIES